MKTVTCKAMGGICDAPLSAHSFEEWMSVGMKHIEEAHPKMAEDIKSMPKDDPAMVTWEINARKTWADTQDDK